MLFIGVLSWFDAAHVASLGLGLMSSCPALLKVHELDYQGTILDRHYTSFNLPPNACS